MIKCACLINRVANMSIDHFINQHRKKNAPFFASKQYIRMYTVSNPIPAPNYPAPTYDGLTEILFDTWEDHDAFFVSKNYLEKVKPDEPTSIDFASVGIMVTEERAVI